MSIEDLIQKEARATPAAPVQMRRFTADDSDEAYDSIGIDGLMAATEKVLAINRGIVDEDERDSPPNDRIMLPDKLLAEQVKLDRGKFLRDAMRRAAHTKSLKSFGPGQFDKYMLDYLKGNPLASPSEQINPTNIADQKRRISKMGPGGIGDPQAITKSMQAVNARQFGFIDPLAGPECFPGDHEVYTRARVGQMDEVTDEDVFACKVDDVLEWHPAERIVREHYSGELVVAEHKTLRMAVTPNHRVVHKRDRATKGYRIESAEEVEGKSVLIPARHLPEVGDPDMRVFRLPEIPVTNPNQKVFQPFDIVDWCAYMGWFLSEGNCFISKSDRLDYESGRVGITQCVEANPEQYQEIRELCLRMGICECDNGKTFLSGAKQLVSYFSQWDQGCYHKWIPEELFHAPIEAREALLHALLKGDGRWRSNRMCYCSVSKKLAYDVERLAISLGYTAYVREEADNREHVTTTNYVTCIHRSELRSVVSTSHLHAVRDKVYGRHWSREQHDGLVYCATVPGGQLHVRGKKGTSGYWTGNSEKAGIDVRMAWGSRIGEDGRIYQKFINTRTGEQEWVSPEDLRDKVVAMPE